MRLSVADATAGPAKVATNSLFRNVARETLGPQIAIKGFHHAEINRHA
jgi:hypothetical protein